MCRRGLISACRRSQLSIINSISSSRGAHTITIPTYSSPFESKILRILSNEIQYQYDYAPPHRPAMMYDRFKVEDRAGEQLITLRGKSGEDENVKIEATMFDGSVIGGEEENARLHISVLVDIWKGEEGTDLMEFICSAWPDSFEIQKVYVFRRDASSSQPYIGPDIKNLSKKLQIEFYNYLKARGIDSDLSKFLHEYMFNKDRIELVHWLRKVQTYFQVSGGNMYPTV